MAEEDEHIASYWADGKIVAQKVRGRDKAFFILGDFKKAGLFGDNIWAPHPKKNVVVVEGELDALAVSQAQGNEWPVVSVPNGANGAVSAFKKNLEYLEGFKSVVIMFDMDEPGQKAARECAEILQVGKVSIASLPLKDACDMLRAGREHEIVKSMWAAKPFMPDGLLTGEAIWDAMTAEDDEDTIPYPYAQLNNWTAGGMRTGALYVWTSGTGMGKSTILGEIALDLTRRDVKVGYLALEETGKQTGARMLSIILGQPLQLLKGKERTELILEHREDVKSFEDRVVIYDHFGMKKDESLIKKVRFMVKAMDCKVIILDHISLVVSAMGDTNERVVLDKLMTDLRTLVSETGCCMHVVSHLSRGSKHDASHEEGGVIKLADLRGSHSIAQLADGVFALQGGEENMIKLVALKQRINGKTGKVCQLSYNPNTGRLAEVGVF